MYIDTPIAEMRVIPVTGLPEVKAGDDIAAQIAHATRTHGPALQAGDVVVVTQKIVSKAEDRLVKLDTIKPSELAIAWAKQWDKDPRHVEVVLRESKRIIRMVNGVLISETHHGFKCANAGVDASNIPGQDVVCLLPVDSDASARVIRDGLRKRLGIEVGVIISDTFGRPWREGALNVCIGAAGIATVVDYRGTTDATGHTLRTTTIAVGDELAGVAELVMRKTLAVPVAIVRGYAFTPSDEGIKPLIRERGMDLFP